MNESKEGQDKHTLGDVIQRALRDPEFLEDLLANREHCEAVLKAAELNLSKSDLTALSEALATDTLHLELDLILKHVRRRKWPVTVWRPPPFGRRP